MSPFNYSMLFLLFCFVVVVIGTSVEVEIGSDLISSPGNNTRSRLHGQVPSESKTKRPKRIHNREGGSRFLARKDSKKYGKKKLDKSAFLRILGDDFKEPWMTYNEPKKPLISIPPEEILNLTAIKGSWATTELESELTRMNLTADLQKYAPELLPYEALVRKFLMKRTSCPVEFTWKDLGNKYWPRWVRHGECKNRDGFCSFPPGMICVPGVSTIVHLLHWECSKEVDRASRSAFDDEGFHLEYKRPAPLELDRNGKTRRVDVLNPPKMETSVLYKKKVPHLPPSPIHLPRRKRRCKWDKVPFLITIDCFCAC